MSLRQAAEQALEALRYTCDYLPAKTGVEREVNDAITALQVALSTEGNAKCNPVKTYCGGKPNYCADADEMAKGGHEPEWIEDGFGTMWQKCGKKDCGRFVVKIGKVDCWNGDCLEVKGKHENLL